MPGEGFLAACVQMRCGVDKQRNLARAAELIATAAQRGARLVVLPEMFFWRGPPDEQPAAAEPLDGPTLTAMSRLAREHRLVLVAGSILERSTDAGLPFNTSAVFDEDGTLRAAYRKIHLFDVEIPGAVSVRESERIGAGSHPVCVDTSLGRIGLSICYDLRFPELYRILALRGAELIAVPSAFTTATGRDHWEVLLRARAIEDQVFVLAPNQTGTAPPHFDSFGHSAIVDPWGTVLAMAPAGEGFVAADLDQGSQRRTRERLPSLANRRPAAYVWPQLAEATA